MSGLRAAIAALCLYAASSTTPIPTTSPSTSPTPTPTTSTSPTPSPIANAADDDDDGTAFGLKLADKAAHSLEIAATIEGLYNAYQISGGSSCKGYSDCATALPAADCDADFGVTNGCDCAGRAVDSTHSTIYARDNVVSPADAKNALCYTNGLDSYFSDLAWNSEASYKWMYFGTQEGVLINFPGLLSSRDSCEAGTYDPRTRPWYVMGASGPKDVILIIDRSGSMSKENRLENAKTAAIGVVNSLTNVDFMSVVTFSTTAQSENSMLVRAEANYRSRMITDIENIQKDAYTHYVRAVKKAFEITAKSDSYDYNSGCTRVYIFLTDGDPTDELSDWQAEIEENKRAGDMWFVIILGAGVSSTVRGEIQAVVCALDGIYVEVPDNNEVALDKAMASYYQYLAVGAMMNEVQPTRWSEPYTSIPDVWGPVVSAVTPVYDKTTSSEFWKIIGVAAVDLPLCELVNDATESDVGWVDDTTDDYRSQKTDMGCACEDTWTYEGTTYAGCTTYDWSKPWCATPEECGFEFAGVSTGWWDDCDVTSATVEGKVASYLQELSSACYDIDETDAQRTTILEVLRDTFTCETEPIDDDEWSSLLITPNAFTCSSDTACSTYESGYSPDNSGVMEAEFDTDVTDCTTCSSAMRPACSLEDCNQGITDAILADSVSAAVAAAPRARGLAVALALALGVATAAAAVVPRP